MQQSKPTKLRDEIQSILTLYTLVPIFFLVLAFCVFFVVYFNSSTINTTQKYNLEVTQKLNSMVGELAVCIEEVGGSLDTELLRKNSFYQHQVLTETSKILNHENIHADFFILDSDFKVLLSSQDKPPNFIPPTAGTNWGIIHKMKRNTHEAQCAFVPTGTSHQKSKTLTIGKSLLGNYGEIDGYIIFAVPGLYLTDKIGDSQINLIVTNQYGDVCISNTNHFRIEFNRTIDEISNLSNFFTYDAEWYYKYSYPINDGEYTVHTMTPIKKSITLFLIYGSLFILIILLVAIATVISSSKLAKSKMQIIDRIVEAFDNVRNGNLDTRMDINTDNEFGFISDSYNIMIESLKEQIERNTQMTRETIVSEIKQLESQFNPHFLFNTLETIKFMVKFAPDDASAMIVSLSSILRYSINNTITNVTLAEDLVNVENYLYIQEIRFHDQLFYKLDIQEEAKACIIPKLIFQPLIENSIIYGFETKDTLNVTIRAYLHDGDLYICVKDDGGGMSQERLFEMRKIISSKKNSSKHIGIYNVNRRIKLTYGEEYGMKLFSKLGEGTEVNIRLPIRRKENLTNVKSINC